MQTGTQILLERMKTNPEEFTNEGDFAGKWGAIMKDARNYLPQEDREALDTAYKQIQVDRFNERVLRRLTGEDEELRTVRYQGLGDVHTLDARAFGQAVAKAEGAEVDSFKLTTSLRGQL